jgi:dephospho-CoA kinase
MLRVGLTGGLGSGKSTVAGLFAQCGVYVLDADSIGRELMQPGEAVYRDILAHFALSPDAPQLTLPDGRLDRAALAQFVFSTGRINELSHIVHPAVISEQERRIAAIGEKDPAAIVMVESALIFEADRAGTAPGLRSRFDKLILVTAPEDARLVRYLARASAGRSLTPAETKALEQDGRRRMETQISEEEKIPLCDFVIDNSGAAERLPETVRTICAALRSAAGAKMPV